MAIRKKIAYFKLGASEHGVLAAPGFLAVQLMMSESMRGEYTLPAAGGGKLTAKNGDTLIAYSDGTFAIDVRQRNTLRGGAHEQEH